MKMAFTALNVLPTQLTAKEGLLILPTEESMFIQQVKKPLPFITELILAFLKEQKLRHARQAKLLWQKTEFQRAGVS